MMKNYPFPDVIRIESSGICNFRCRHCPTSYRKVDRGILSQSMFDLLLEQFTEKNYIPRVAILYHGGEPLLNNKLLEMLSILKNMGVQKTMIVTNISCMTQKIARKLSKGNLDEMHVSFDGNTPKENDYIRQNAHFDKEHKNLLYFLSINDKTNVKISNVQILMSEEISSYVEGNDLSCLEYLIEKFSSYSNVSFQSIPAMEWPGLCTPQYGRYKFHKGTKFECTTFKETITILSNGDVVPCCYDLLGDDILGNIQKNSIFDIRANKESKRYFLAMESQNSIPKICQKCLIFSGAYLVQNKL